MKGVDIAKSINPEAEYTIIGVRPGEKLHEQMISKEDAPYTYEYIDHYKILPAINDWSINSERINGGQLVPPDFSYSSDLNPDWMEIDELRKWITENKENIGSI